MSESESHMPSRPASLLDAYARNVHLDTQKSASPALNGAMETDRQDVPADNNTNSVSDSESIGKPLSFLRANVIQQLRNQNSDKQKSAPLDQNSRQNSAVVEQDAGSLRVMDGDMRMDVRQDSAGEVC